MTRLHRLPPYGVSLAGTLLAAREAVMTPIRPILRSAGVTDQQWRVLRVLGDEGDLDPSTLAACAILHAPSVTRILKELLERGLIERDADEEDGRRSIVRLTSSGFELVQSTAIDTLEVLDTYSQQFGEKRLRALREELVALTLAIGIAPIRGAGKTKAAAVFSRRAKHDPDR